MRLQEHSEAALTKEQVNTGRIGSGISQGCQHVWCASGHAARSAGCCVGCRCIEVGQPPCCITRQEVGLGLNQPCLDAGREEGGRRTVGLAEHREHRRRAVLPEARGGADRHSC